MDQYYTHQLDHLLLTLAESLRHAELLMMRPLALYKGRVAAAAALCPRLLPLSCARLALLPQSYMTSQNCGCSWLSSLTADAQK